MIERLLRDGAVYALAAVVSRGAAFVLVPIYTRLLDPARYGALELMLTAGLLVNLVVALEVGQGLAREWPEEADAARRRRLASTALTFTALVHAGFMLIALAAAGPLAEALLGSPALAPELRAGLVFVALNAVFLQLHDQFRWRMRARGYAAVGVLHALATIALGAGLGRTHGLQGVLWGQALAAGCAGLVCLALLRAEVGAVLDRAMLARMLRFSLPLAASGVTMFAAFHANRLMLSAIVSLGEVGVLGVGQRIAGLTSLLIVGLQGGLMPLVYRHHREPGVPAQLARLFEGFLALAMLACLTLSVFARELVGLFAAPDFAAAARLLPWLAPAAILSQMYILAPGIAIARRTGWQLALTALSAMLALALNLALIPRWGALGAAVANCAAAAAFLALWVAAGQRAYALPLRWAAVAAGVAAYLGTAWIGASLDALAWSAPLTSAAKTLIVAALAVVLALSGLLHWRGSAASARLASPERR